MPQRMLRGGILVAFCSLALSSGAAGRPPGPDAAEEAPGPALPERTIVRASNAGPHDDFGASVSVSGDTAIVGASGEDGDGESLDNSGAAYLFARDQGPAYRWGQVAKLTASDTRTADEFGVSVAAAGRSAIVGTRQEDGGAGDPLDNAGAVYVFREGFLSLFIGDG